MKRTVQELSSVSQAYRCEWCDAFMTHLQEMMQLALYLSGAEDRVEGIVLEALDMAIAQREVLPSRDAARRFVLRVALHATWKALRPTAQEAVLAAA